MPSAAQTLGAASGGIILTLFGAFWCVIALTNWPAHPPWSIPFATAATAALLFLCALRIRTARNIPSVHDPIAAAKGKRVGMLFGIISGIEGGLIAACAIVLGRHGLSLWIPFAVALVVGLHFLPLAHVFEMPLYYGTGISAVIGVLGCLLIGNIHTRVLCVGLVMAAVLWFSVIAVLVQTRIVIRNNAA